MVHSDKIATFLIHFPLNKNTKIQTHKHNIHLFYVIEKKMFFLYIYHAHGQTSVT